MPSVSSQHDNSHGALNMNENKQQLNMAAGWLQEVKDNLDLNKGKLQRIYMSDWLADWAQLCHIIDRKRNKGQMYDELKRTTNNIYKVEQSERRRESEPWFLAMNKVSSYLILSTGRGLQQLLFFDCKTTDLKTSGHWVYR